LGIFQNGLKAVYTFRFRPYGTCLISRPSCYRYYIPNGTKGNRQMKDAL